jgi:hypothetical protein
VRLLPLANGDRLQFELDPVPFTLHVARVGYVLARVPVAAGRAVLSACPLATAPVPARGYRQVLLRHFCDRDRSQDVPVMVAA